MDRTISWTGKRLYDVVTRADVPWRMPSFALPLPNVRGPNFPAFQASLAARIRTAPVIVADNIVEHMYMGTPQDEWILQQHFPNVAPPFERYWIEGRRPSGCRTARAVTSATHLPAIAGVYFESCTSEQALVNARAAAADGQVRAQMQKMVELNANRLGRDGVAALRVKLTTAAAARGRQLTNDDLAHLLTPAEHGLLTGLQIVKGIENGQGVSDMMRDVLSGTRWHIQGIVFFSDGSDGVIGPAGTITYNVLDTGRVAPNCEGINLCYPVRDELSTHNIVDLLWWTAKPFLLAVCFMHAKNVSTPRVIPPARLSAKHTRRYGQPLTTYRVLVIEPTGRETTAPRPGADQAARALHLCRGHFKTFTAEHPLFGKYTGTFWWADSVRGTPEAGTIVKRYDVRP